MFNDSEQSSKFFGFEHSIIRDQKGMQEGWTCSSIQEVIGIIGRYTLVLKISYNICFVFISDL